MSIFFLTSAASTPQRTEETPKECLSTFSTAAARRLSYRTSLPMTRLQTNSAYSSNSSQWLCRNSVCADSDLKLPRHSPPPILRYPHRLHLSRISRLPCLRRCRINVPSPQIHGPKLCPEQIFHRPTCTRRRIIGLFRRRRQDLRRASLRRVRRSLWSAYINCKDSRATIAVDLSDKRLPSS